MPPRLAVASQRCDRLELTGLALGGRGDLAAAQERWRAAGAPRRGAELQIAPPEGDVAGRRRACAAWCQAACAPASRTASPARDALRVFLDVAGELVVLRHRAGSRRRGPSGSPRCAAGRSCRSPPASAVASVQPASRSDSPADLLLHQRAQLLEVRLGLAQALELNAGRQASRCRQRRRRHLREALPAAVQRVGAIAPRLERVAAPSARAATTRPSPRGRRRAARRPAR